MEPSTMSAARPDRTLSALVLVLALGLALPAASASAASASGAPPAAEARRLQPDPARLDAPSKSYDLLHTTLDLQLDLEHGQVRGLARHRIRMLQDAAAAVVLHARDLQVQRVLVGDAPLHFEQRDQELWIYLQGTAAAAGAEAEISVEYSASPVVGMHFRRPSLSPAYRYPEVWTQGEGEENRFWFPSWDYPNDLATYTGIFTVDDGIEVLSNGALEERTHVGNRTRFRYEQRAPHANYLVMVAAGPYQLHEYPSAVLLQYWVPPGTDRQLVRESFAVTAPALQFMAEYTGAPYPWDKYAQVVVQDFLYGGMENSSATVLHMRCLVPAQERGARDADDLLVHEAAHQWFGDAITCYGWSPMWLNEGFATYFNALFDGQQRGEPALVYFMDQQQQAVLKADQTLARPLATSFFNRIDDEQSANVYSKGASVLHMLRGVLGDAAFRRGIQLYCQRRTHTLVTTADFQRDMQDATGQSLDWFMQQWVDLAGHPRFAVSYDWDDASHMIALHVRQTQEPAFLVPTFRVPVEIELGWDGGSERRTFWIDRADTTFSAALSRPPRMVVFDARGLLLKELDFPRSREMLLYQLNNAGHFWGRVEAVRGLGELRARDADVVQSLVHLLHGPSQWQSGEEQLRGDVAAALGKIGGPDARDALITQLQGAADAPRVRLACAKALQQFAGDAEALRALRAALAEDASAHVRAEALRSLVALRPSDARALCVTALASSSDREVLRLAALDGLATLEDARALVEVLRYTAAPYDRDLRLRAIAVAGALAKGSASSGRGGGAADRTIDHAADRLALCLADPLARIRTAAGAALGELGSRRALAPLQGAVAAERDPAVREALGKAVRKLESGAGS